jgi:hypothetical protein
MVVFATREEEVWHDSLRYTVRSNRVKREVGVREAPHYMGLLFMPCLVVQRGS